MNKWILLVLSTLLTPITAFAYTSSPFDPGEEALGTYLVNSGPGLDTGCVFRSSSPLLISLPVPQVINPAVLNSDGTIKSSKIAQLIKDGVIGSKAVISFPVYDIDDKANVTEIEPEVDEIYFNGELIKTLSGTNNLWTDDSLLIDIEKLRFGQDNEIRINIDVANSSNSWCMAVDWVKVEFDVTSPVVLVHGIDGDAGTWSSDDLEALNQRGLHYKVVELDGSAPQFSPTGSCAQTYPNQASYTGKNGRSHCNARELDSEISDFLDPLKAKEVSIIAHSKGGLDSQALQYTGPEYEIVSLSTLSTPHKGSVVADMTVIRKERGDELQNSGLDPNNYIANYLSNLNLGITFGIGPQMPGLLDLKTQAYYSELSAGRRGNIAKTFTIGASADNNNNGIIESGEDDEINSAGFLSRSIMQNLWNLLYYVDSIKEVSSFIEERTVPVYAGGVPTYITYKVRVYQYASTPTVTGRPNDLAVTTNSANPSYGTSLGNVHNNHSTVKNPNALNIVLDKILSLRSSQ